MGGLDDPAYGRAVVGQVVLGEGVQDPGEPVGGQPLHVGGDVPQDPPKYETPALNLHRSRREAGDDPPLDEQEEHHRRDGERVDLAITPPHSVPWLVVKEASQIPRVCLSGLRRST